MSSWLDTQAKELLQAAPPDKPAPPGTAAFTLILLTKGLDTRRLVLALRTIRDVSPKTMARAAAEPTPVILRRGLLLEDALLSQSELICCDSVSVFLRDEVVLGGSAEYLEKLFAQLRHSPEFQKIAVGVKSLPDDDAGRRFAVQFLGLDAPQDGPSQVLPFQGRFMRKKARIMAYWAKKIGAEVWPADL